MGVSVCVYVEPCNGAFSFSSSTRYVHTIASPVRMCACVFEPDCSMGWRSCIWDDGSSYTRQEQQQ